MTVFRGILRVLGASAGMQGINVLLFVPSCIEAWGSVVVKALRY
jgi:hypothetical protein